MMVSIDQRKKPSKETEEIAPNAELIDGKSVNKGYFEKWGNSGELGSKGEIITGGLLHWIQEGT